MAAFDCLAQIVHRIVRCVEYPVRELLDIAERGAFLSDAVEKRGRPLCQRMRPAGLAETPHERLVRRLQEEHLDGRARGPEPAEELRKNFHKSFFSDVNADGGMKRLA